MAHRERRDAQPLLENGLHPLTLAEIRQLCVNEFSSAMSRDEIMGDLESLVAWMGEHGLSGELWIDGSFLTRDLRPKDVDVLFCPSLEFILVATEVQKDVIISLSGGTRPTCAPHCETYVCYEVPKNDHRYNEHTRTYWLNQFGRSRQHEPKGIATLRVGEVPQ